MKNSATFGGYPSINYIVTRWHKWVVAFLQVRKAVLISLTSLHGSYKMTVCKYSKKESIATCHLYNKDLRTHAAVVEWHTWTSAVVILTCSFCEVVLGKEWSWWIFHFHHNNWQRVINCKVPFPSMPSPDLSWAYRECDAFCFRQSSVSCYLLPKHAREHTTLLALTIIQLPKWHANCISSSVGDQVSPKQEDSKTQTDAPTPNHILHTDRCFKTFMCQYTIICSQVTDNK